MDGAAAREGVSAQAYTAVFLRGLLTLRESARKPAGTWRFAVSIEDALRFEWGSVPGLRGVVPRYRRIRYQGFDTTANAIDLTVEGFHARVVQHECHLIGMLYPMRVRDFTHFGEVEALFPDRQV